jgi:predicted MFS family arabinose efflux permease
VLSRIRDRNIWLVYGAVLLLGTAYGLAVALLSLHLDARGFDKKAIGTLAVWFASGIVALALPAGQLVRRFSAKYTLVGALAGYAVSVALFPALRSYEAIAVARFADGAFSACIWVAFETVLLERSDAHNKAYVTSLYATAVAVGYVLGPLAAKAVVRFAPVPLAFLAAGAIAAASCLLVALRLDRDVPGRLAHGRHPTVETENVAPRATSFALLRANRTSCFATFAYGYFQASVVLFLPLYLIESKGIAREQTILIPAFFATGMLLFANLAGRVGDRVGHLRVMRVLAAIGMVMILGFVFLGSFAPMALAVFIAGATLASISPVSLALQGVTTEPQDYGRANAIYNAFYAAGILCGPPVASTIFARYGGAPMLFHLAALWAAFVLFSVIFATDDPAARRAARSRALPARAPATKPFLSS